MKTAISLPDALFAHAQSLAQAMGIPRSQLFALALEEFIRRHQHANTTNQLNAVYELPTTQAYGEVVEASLDSLRKLTQNDAW